MGISRWDLFLEETPAYVWHGWERWMEENPDHPAHRDQLFTDVAALSLKSEYPDLTSENLMDFRLRDPAQRKK